VAELAAQEAPVDAVLETVAVQASRLAGVDFTALLRFDPDGSTEIVAVDGAPGDIRTGMRAPAGGDGAVQRVWRSGRAARIDDLAEMSGHWPRVAHDFGFTASVAVPILLERRLWGALVVVARREPLPPSIERHLTDFAELASTAIGAAQTRRELHVLASEQAALRRVAELVAHGAALDEVFGAVAAEASKQLGGLATALVRSEPEDVTVVVARCDGASPPGAQIGPGIAAPVVVEGRVWGSLATAAPVPDGTADRLQPFAELAAAAIANAENKAKLTASRARVVATADETRRRLQRDLHDGAQQRLVHAQITLELAKHAAEEGRPTSSLIEAALAHAERANRELGDFVRGILPAALTGGGLRTGIESLTDDIALPIDLHVTVPRLPAQTEITAYFVVAEALTNVVKHAHATRATVDVELHGREVSIDVRDDGVGGADAARGTGLTGLFDRIEAADGTLTISSAPGGGTALHAVVPVAV
jgi:signal transduction histidine kinase